MALTVAELNAKLTADTSAFRTAMNKAESSAKTTFDKIGAAGDKMKSVGTKMTTHFTLPIVAGLGLAAKSFGDFETSLNTFQAVSSATRTEMERVGKLAKDLGNDVKLPATSAKDAAEAMTELAKAGLNVQQSMDAARAVLQLSAAAQIDNAQAAVIVGDALNAFRLPGKEAARVADLLAGAANSASGEITDMASSLQMSAAVFAAAGVPVEDLTTAIALMARNGIKGSDAGTSLKTALIHLQNPSEKAAGVMKELGFNIFDAEGNMKSMRQIIADLAKATKGLTEEQRAQALATLFGTDGLRAANILLAEGVQGFDAMRESVTKTGSAQAVAEAKTKGFNGSLQALKSQLETLAITVGPAVTDFLGKVIMILGPLVNWFANLNGGVQTVILVMLGLVAALGPMLALLGNLLVLIPLISAAFAFLAANPIVLIIAGIVALGAAVVVAYNKFETFRNVVQAVLAWIKDHWGTVLTIIAGPIGLAVALVIKNFDSIKGAVQSVWDFVRPIFEAMGRAIKTVAGPLGDIVGKVGGLAGKGLSLLPKFHDGGIVPGPRGADVPIMAQAGETIIPAGAGGGGMGGGITVIVEGSVITERDLGRVVADAIRNNGLYGVN